MADVSLGTTIVAGLDAGSFEIIGTELFLKAGANINYEALNAAGNSVLDVVVDNGGNQETLMLQIDNASGGTSIDDGDRNYQGQDLSGFVGFTSFMLGAYLVNSNLSSSIFPNSTFINANLTGADLIGTNFNLATFFNADLSNADLSGASLISVNFSGADLSFANFSGADLSFANLNIANLTNADFGISNLTAVQLNQASTSAGIILDGNYVGGVGADGTLLNPIQGGLNNDSMAGGAGNDFLDGGVGTYDGAGGVLLNDVDTAVFTGNLADYTVVDISALMDGSSLQVTDNVGTDGTDILHNFEMFQFVDGTVDLVTLLAPPPIFSNALSNLSELGLTGSDYNEFGTKVADVTLGTTIFGGQDAALFEIIGTELFLKAGANINFEKIPFGNTVLDVVVDNGGNQEILALQIDDADDATTQHGGDLNFQGQNISANVIMPADFSGAYFVGAALVNTTAANVNFTGANFTDAILQGASFVSSIFIDADFTNANLLATTLTNADFNGADLTGANMAAFMNGTDFGISNITTAQLNSSANAALAFIDVDLEGNFIGTAAAETVFGGLNADTIQGNGGDDILDGGTGTYDVPLSPSGMSIGVDFDTAVFNGNRADYTVVDLGGGSVQLTDTVGTDGTDILHNFESFQFIDGTVNKDILLSIDLNISELGSTGSDYNEFGTVLVGGLAPFATLTGPDAGLFSVDGAGDLILNAGVNINAEVVSSYSVIADGQAYIVNIGNDGSNVNSLGDDLNFQGENLAGLDPMVMGEDFSNAYFVKADLSNAAFIFAPIFNGADFSGAKMIGTRIEGSLIGVNFTGANLTSATLSASTAINADFSNARLVDASLILMNLTNASFTSANLVRADLSGSTAINADFSGANMSVSNMLNANLTGADLSGTNFNLATFFNADLSNADLSGASLINTFFSSANLNFIDWSGVTVINNTVLGSADLGISNITVGQLNTAIGGFLAIINGNFVGDATDETVFGGLGNDIIDGGAHVLGDTAQYWGSASDYTVGFKIITGEYIVETLNAHTNGDEGTDTLANIEFLEFLDDGVGALLIDDVSNVMKFTDAAALEVGVGTAGKQEIFTWDAGSITGDVFSTKDTISGFEFTPSTDVTGTNNDIIDLSVILGHIDFTTSNINLYLSELFFDGNMFIDVHLDGDVGVGLRDHSIQVEGVDLINAGESFQTLLDNNVIIVDPSNILLP